MKDGRKFESDEFMRTTETEDEKMRQTLIPGRRDGRQCVVGRGVSTFRMCDGQTDKVRSHRIEEAHKRDSRHRDVLFSPLKLPYSYFRSRWREAARNRMAEVTTGAAIMSYCT